MKRKFKNYLKKFNQATGYTGMLDGLRQQMKATVPKITESIRQREMLAAELRIAASKPSQANKEKKD